MRLKYIEKTCVSLWAIIQHSWIVNNVPMRPGVVQVYSSNLATVLYNVFNVPSTGKILELRCNEDIFEVGVCVIPHVEL